jgi:hypothetical protein
MADDAAEDTTGPPGGHPAHGGTIKTPLGPMNRQMITIVIAISVGIVGFAFWRNRSAGTAAAAAAQSATDAALTPATDFTPAPTGDSTVSSDTSTQPSTNAQWTQQAISYLSSVGFDPSAVATALGLYLARQPVTSDQAAIINDARASTGEPPTGGPYPLVTGLPGATTTPPPSGTYQYTTTGSGDTSVSLLIHKVYQTPYTDYTEYSILANEILSLNPDRSTWSKAGVTGIPKGTVITLPAPPHLIK